jgi:hypothetical protein
MSRRIVMNGFAHPHADPSVKIPISKRLRQTRVHTMDSRMQAPRGLIMVGHDRWFEPKDEIG